MEFSLTFFQPINRADIDILIIDVQSTSHG